MSLNVSLPGVRQPVIETGGTATRPYYVFFQSVATSLQALSDQIGNVTTTPPETPISENANVTGKYSIYTRGTLKTGIVSVFLTGDVEAPEATQYYGSNADGEKGWYAISDAFAESDNVTLTTDSDGITTPDLSDTGVTAGTYGDATKAVTVTFDAKGRASSVEEKDIRVLSDTAPSSPVAGMRWIDTTTGTEYVWYVDADSSQWVEFGPNAVSVADGPAVQTVSSGDNITVDNTDPANPVINYSGPTSGYAEGTSFPASPALNDKFYRTDLNLLCFYDGTRWLTAQEYALPSGLSEGANSFFNVSSAFTSWRAAVRSDFELYLTRWAVTSRVQTTNDGSNYYTVNLDYQNAATTASLIASFSTNADAASTIVQHDQQIDAALDASAVNIIVVISKTGTPGACHVIPALYYRLIVT